MPYQDYTSIAEAWKHARFPARPSKEELVVFNVLMHKRKKLLILGATPELRDLATKNNLEITCVDLNRTMYDAMSLLMKEFSENENFVKADWLDMPFKDETFDIIIAEQSINILETEKWPAFLKEVKRVLCKDGIFVLKSIVPLELSEEEIFSIVRTQKRDVCFIYDRIINRTEIYIKNRIGHTRVSEYFMKLFTENKITETELEEFFKRFGAICESNLILNALPQREFDELVEKYFEVKSVAYGDDFEKHRAHPIYVLKKLS